MHPTLLLALKATLLLAAAAALVRLLSKANPRWRMFVCQSVAAGVVILPLATLLPFDIPVNIAAPSRTTTPSGAAEAVADFPIAEAPSPASIAIGTKAGSTGNLAKGSTPNWFRLPSLPSPAQTIFGIYVLGLVVLVARFAIANRRLKRWVASLPPADTTAQRHFAELAEETLPGQLPDLKVAPGEVSPFCTGLRRPTVVIPESMACAAKRESLDFVLRHELHHLANHDLHRTTLIGLATALLWFHPLAWIVRRQHAEAMEELGDRVASGDEAGRSRYRSMLATAALEIHSAKQPPAAVALGLFRTPQIVTRLRRLALDSPHAELRRAPRAMFILAVALPALVTLAGINLVRAHVGTETTGVKASGLVATLATEDQELAEQSIERALEHLMKTKGVGVGATNATGTHALLGLALAAHGGADPESPYHAKVSECIDYVLSAQKEAGEFSADSEGARGTLYNHTTATTFLAEVLPKARGARSAKIRRSLELALGVLVQAQGVPKAKAHQGGWRYTTEAKDSDLSCTAWAIRALYAIEKAGIDVPDKVLADAVAYIERSQLEDGGFVYTPGAGQSTTSLTAAGLYCLHKAGKGDSEAAKKAAKRLVAQLEKPAKHYHFYGLMWAANAMGERGGEDAANLFRRMVRHCNREQTETGSWPCSFGSVLGASFVLIGYGS